MAAARCPIGGCKDGVAVFDGGCRLQNIVAKQSNTVDDRAGQRLLEDDAHGAGSGEGVRRMRL